MTKSEEVKKPSSGQISEEVEAAIGNLPKMHVSNLRFLLLNNDTKTEELKTELLTLITENNMAPYYEKVAKELNWQLDNDLLQKMQQANEEELKKLELQRKDAEENLGDIEVLESILAKANLFSLIGDKEKALATFEEATQKPQSINQKIQISLHVIRLGLFFTDYNLVKENIAKATKLIDEGGDWDRRNRLKVYEGCYLIMSRDLKKSSKLFQESVATFSSYELMDYNTMIFYCLLTNVMSLSRMEMTKKIVQSPEISAVIRDIPHMSDFVSGLYDCQYKKFFTAMVELHPYINRDRYLSAHSRYIYRELRVLAYAQFLEAYRSVTMESMASAFGVSVGFLDAELSRFIAAGRLNAKIDKVGGVIETNRPDAKNAQYQDTIKKGDLLLNRIQRLGRVINV